MMLPMMLTIVLLLIGESNIILSARFDILLVEVEMKQVICGGI
jgi:hypothetical protein